MGDATSVRDTIERRHAAAWRFGQSHFGYAGDPPQPVGMLIGEAPGPNTDARLPLFPNPVNSAGARLLRYADVEPAVWMGKLIRINMCDEAWSARGGISGKIRALSFLLDETNFVDGAPLRVLLLGARVARAWSCYGPFGHGVHCYGGGTDREADLSVAWIPRPSGRNLLYNSRFNQLRARHAVLWAIGERDKP